MVEGSDGPINDEVEDEATGEKVLLVDLKQGKQEVSVWTCDLTPGYVKINAEYS